MLKDSVHCLPSTTPSKLDCLSAVVSLYAQHVMFPKRRLCSTTELFRQFSEWWPGRPQ